jgi:hypothetical protein
MSEVCMGRFAQGSGGYNTLLKLKKILNEVEITASLYNERVQYY